MTNTHTHGRTVMNGGIGPSQRPLPHNTQHSQATDNNSPAGFETAIPASELPQTHALGYGYVGTTNDTTQQSGQTPDMEV